MSLTRREPRQSRFLLALLGCGVLATVPWPWIGAIDAHFAGIPLWLWWSFGGTTFLSCVTTLGVLRYWRDDRYE
ncbi:MAG: hypothetical protein RL885_00555 [Planctomycetota bacterium]